MLKLINKGSLCAVRYSESGVFVKFVVVLLGRFGDPFGLFDGLVTERVEASDCNLMYSS